MTRDVQQRGGSTAFHSGFTGLDRQITVDTDKRTIVVHDGATVGGFPLARADQLPQMSTATRFVTGDGVLKIVRLTQYAYDNLAQKDETTLYVIVAEGTFLDTMYLSLTQVDVNFIAP